MMSLRAVNAGSGYEYLLRSVATNDAPSDAPSLQKYYQQKGTPAGRWMGAGLAGFNSETYQTGEEVTESAMAALYGEGLHPDADEMMLEGASIKDCQLGRPFPTFTNGDPLLDELREAERAYRQREQRVPGDEERAAMALEIGTKFFIDEKGVEPESGREVIAWVNARKDKVRQAVAGFDLTFSPSKSVSVLWALADEDMASKIAACHHKAVAESIEWAQDNVLRTRSGAGGLQQVKTKGIIAAEFTHFDTRAGDPDLHSHVLVSNKVQDEDGKWKAIDGRTIFRHHQAIGFRYNTALNDLLSRELGIEMEAHDRGEGKEPVWEVAGVPQRLLDAFSKRRSLAQPVFEAKKQAWIDCYSAVPSDLVLNRLWQEAILETRDAKKPAQALSELRDQWAEEVRSMPAGQELIDHVQSLSHGMDEKLRPVFSIEEHSNEVATLAMETVVRRRSTFRRSHVHTAVAGKLSAYRFESGEARQEAHDLVVEQIIAQSVALNELEPLELPNELLTDGGKAVDHLLDSELFTTHEILEAEQAALDACVEPVAVFAPAAVVDEALERHEQENGWALNSGQAELARHLVTCGTLAATGVGPAGTGKTASMKLVSEGWATTGGKVIGLAPSAAAAQVLGEDLGTDAHTIDSLTYTWTGKNPNRQARSIADLPVEINPGDMLLVDEAGMASTPNISALIEIARESGAVVRFIGDHLQLGAVESGGLFGAMANSSSSVTLTQVMRFGDDEEQAKASLKLREGDTSGLDLLESRGWVHGGDRVAMVTQAAQDYLGDLRAGRTSLLLADSNADADQLNEMIRAHQIEHGQVRTDKEVTLARGDKAGVGDTIITRKNTTFMQDRDGTSGRVLNGDLWQITKVHSDGSVTVRKQGGRTTMVLPQAYLQDSAHLGYAATVHRAQGATVDVCRSLIDETVDRAELYVAVTRGKHANHVYAVQDVSFDLDAEQGQLHYKGEKTAPTAREVLEAAVRRDNRELSALETIQRETEQAVSPERMKALWNFGRDKAVNAFIERHIHTVYDLLTSELISQLKQSEAGDQPIRTAWKELIGKGVDPRNYLDDACADLAGARDIAALLNYRFKQFVPADGHTQCLPPLDAGTDMELAQWLEDNAPIPESQIFIEDGATITGEDFSGQSFVGVHLTGVTFKDCDFNGANFDDSTLEKVRFTNCSLEDATFRGATVGGAHPVRTKVAMMNCRAGRSNFTGTVLKAFEATLSDFTGARFTNAVAGLFQAVRSRFTNADFAGFEVTNPVSQMMSCTDLPDKCPIHSHGEPEESWHEEPLADGEFINFEGEEEIQEHTH